MPSFFIDRPIFAWVVALFICLIGAISIPLLAVAQYPIIAPPSISISTSYPGASPENLYNSVTRLIEEELNGASGILNFESTSDSLGQVEITANFVPGTDTGAASVEVQNRIKRVEARLPRAVIQQGILVEEASSAVLQIITLRSTDGSLDEIGLGDFMIRNVLGEIRRIPGVGRATLYSTERSLRIWIDPAKLVGYGLTADDVNKAITAQNAQVASGSIGAEPSTPDQKISALVLVKGQLASPDEFGVDHPARQADGSTVRLRDVARIEIGGLSYQFNTRLNGKPTAGLSVLLSPTGNALATASAVEAKMKELSRFFPANIGYEIPYNITPVVEGVDREGAVDAGRSRGAGVHRDVPVPAEHPLHHHSDHRGAGGAARHLRDAAAGGYSINMLTMFGMVLAVGILVDDAIVVVENVERIMAEEGLPPKEATRKAMSQIIRRHHRHHAGADGGVRADGVLPGFGRHHLPAVLGDHGGRDRLLRAAGDVADAGLVRDAAEAGRGRSRPCAQERLFRLVQPWPRCRARTAIGHGRLVAASAPAADADLCGAAGRLAWAFIRLPGGFLPVDDQGFITTDVQTPSDSSYAPHRGGGREGGKISGATRRRRERHVPHRLQLLGPGHEHGTGLHHAEGLVGARAAKIPRRRSSPTSTGDLSSIRDAEDLGAAAAADRQSRQLLGLQLPPAGPRPEGLSGADAARPTG